VPEDAQTAAERVRLLEASALSVESLLQGLWVPTHLALKGDAYPEIAEKFEAVRSALKGLSVAINCKIREETAPAGRADA